MGAYSFEAVGVGKNATEAFEAARDHALWEHGHGGYSGTIAEKGAFVLFTLPPRTPVRRFFSWIEDDMARITLAEWKENLQREVRWAEEVKRGSPGRAERLRRTRAALNGAERSYNRFWNKIPPGLHDTVRKAALTYEDKWGPAVAVELRRSDITKLHRTPDLKRGQKVFTFAGMASS